MTEKTKIAFSAKELQMVSDKEWILTKQLIIEKVCQFFGSMALTMQGLVQNCGNNLPEQATKSNPKISRGENYEGLPYVMLDYPRYFTKESTLAIRTLFWWGNFISISLQLSGTIKDSAIQSLIANLIILQQKDYSICVNTDPWKHHFGADNYVPLKNVDATEFAARLYRESFIKIAISIPLQQWDIAPFFLEVHFREMIMLLNINCPIGEKDPLPGIPITGFDL